MRMLKLRAEPRSGRREKKRVWVGVMGKNVEECPLLPLERLFYRGKGHEKSPPCP